MKGSPTPPPDETRATGGHSRQARAGDPQTRAGVSPARRDLRAPLATDSLLRPSFTMEQVRTFLVVASREHVTHAAKVLRLSQPAVTQQVQLLERALGVRLLERVGRSVRLTDAGVEVAGACLLVMRSLENVEAVAHALRGLKIGSVTVGTSQLAGDYLLPRVLANFVAAHSRIDISVVIADGEQVHQQVAAGHVDCALIDGVPPAPQLRLRHTVVATTDVLIVAHPRDIPCPGREPPENVLRRLKYLEWGYDSILEPPADHAIEQLCRQLPKIQIGSMEAARRSVLTASGFMTIMPLIAVEDELESGALVALGRHSKPLPTFAVRRQAPASPAVDALWQVLSRPSERA